METEPAALDHTSTVVLYHTSRPGLKSTSLGHSPNTSSDKSETLRVPVSCMSRFHLQADGDVLG